MNFYRKMIIAIRFLRLKVFGGFGYLGNRVVVEKNVELRNTRFMSWGNKVTIDANSVIYVLDPGRIKKQPKLVLEDGVGIGIGCTILVGKLVHLEKGVMLGPNCVIVDYDHEYANINKHIVNQPLGNLRSILIQEGAWIGAHSVVTAGVKIGKNSVVGAGSVVTRDIPDHCVAVGAPARVIKKFDQRTKTWIRV